jgi:hypothetical protein
MAFEFKAGWSPVLGQRARARFAAAGRTFASTQFADDRTRPRAFSLSFLVRWAYNQGSVGSCFANMMAAILQVLEGADNQQVPRWEVANPSRRLIWRRCRELDGTAGSGGDGGSIVHSYSAVGPTPDGWGACKEEEWPYKAEHRWLEARPPQSVLDDCQIRIKDIAPARDETDWDRLNFSGHPIGLGIWWPYGWDSQIDRFGRTTGIGRGSFGHAIARIGWFQDWDGHNYSQILNSHGAIYPALPAEIASEIPGYKPSSGDKTHDFWARDDMLAEVIHSYSGGNAELYTGALASGFKARNIDTGWRDFM